MSKSGLVILLCALVAGVAIGYVAGSAGDSPESVIDESGSGRKPSRPTETEMPGAVANADSGSSSLEALLEDLGEREGGRLEDDRGDGGGGEDDRGHPNQQRSIGGRRLGLGRAGLRRVQDKKLLPGELEAAVATTGTIELGFLERGLVILATIANVAPLMGFLGTVYGMVMAFGAIEAAGPYVEFAIEGADYYPWQQGLYDPVLEARDGKVAIPDEPGWGVTINPRWLESAEYRVSSLA